MARPRRAQQPWKPGGASAMVASSVVREAGARQSRRNSGAAPATVGSPTAQAVEQGWRIGHWPHRLGRRDQSPAIEPGDLNGHSVCRPPRREEGTTSMAANQAGTTQSLPPVTLVLGGARSGKSNFAERITVTHARGCAYLATAEIGDDEMAERVRKHKARSEAHWRTAEAPLEIGGAIVADRETGAAVVVD